MAFAFRPINIMVTLLKLKKCWNSTCGLLIIGIELNPSSSSKADCTKSLFCLGVGGSEVSTPEIKQLMSCIPRFLPVFMAGVTWTLAK